MQTLEEYVKIIGNGNHKYKRLYICAAKYPSGICLNIYVLPRVPKFDILDGAVEVYGIGEGSEPHGWLNHGPWEQDFEEFVEQRRATYDERTAKAAAEAEAERMRIIARQKERERKAIETLADYP